MSAGSNLSKITPQQGWKMFDTMTASAMLMGGPIVSIDKDVAEILKGELKEFTKALIRTQLLAKGYIH